MSAIKAAARARLLAIPGVHCVALGPKFVGGQRTSEPSIIVSVVKKKPLDAILPEDRIPTEIQGVKTDVVEEDIPVHRADVDDDDHYDELLGGIQIGAGGKTAKGTLGCIGFFPQEPVPRVVGITNWHVTGKPGGIRPELEALRIDPDTVGFATSAEDNKAGPANTIAVIHLRVGPVGNTEEFDVYVQTLEGDTIGNVADRLADNINALSLPGLTATSHQHLVTLIQSPGFAVIQLATHTVSGPQQADYDLDLRARVVGNLITLSGSVSEEDFGIYATVHVSGLLSPTRGAFIRVDKGMTVPAIATRLAQAISEQFQLSATALGSASRLASSSGVRPPLGA